MSHIENNESNVTGIASAGQRAQEMLTATVEFPPTSHATPRDRAQMRARYARDADPMDEMPPGTHPDQETATFFDKLGERVAFERAGVRLYDALMTKFSAVDGSTSDIDPVELQTIRDQEHEHYLMLVEVIEQLGGDPTAITPSANASGLIGDGVGAVLGDPRTTVAQCIEAMLVAELADHEGWELLAEMAQSHGHHALASRFRAAQRTEQRHLMQLRRWVAASQGLDE